ncbi:transporter [Dyella amyloliquefaciens]|uniref:transporter n=1 Tax=Dyella amyloliquefaciens TaxID=1770545 RepID=UPI0013EE45E7|nr:transporter [Dyella amyloliquefaciens]
MPITRALIVAGIVTLSATAHAQESNDNAELAKKLSNPVAAMISVPFQFNYDQNIGPLDDGHRTYMNFQPVIPVPIGNDWNMISRTIVPVIDQSQIAPGTGHQFGLGDITQSLFFSPSKPSSSGIIWGVGPAFLIPTATDDLLGSKRWGLGPTAVVLKQDHAWTYGFLFNHIWSIAKVGNDRTHSDISNTFIQPFLSYNTPTAWTYGLNAESTYDWKAHQWAVPVNLTIGKLVRIGNHPVSFTGGVRYWAQHTDAGQKGWGFRFVVTLLVPEKR